MAGGDSQSKQTKKNGILVVDDEAPIRALFKLFLEKDGIPTFEAGNGEEAVAVFLRECDHIGLVVTDIMMPILDGVRAFEQMRKFDPSIICFFMSGDSGPYTMDELLKKGASKIFTKPLDMKEVVPAIRQVLITEKK